MRNSAVQVWQVAANEADSGCSAVDRPADFIGACRAADAGVLHVEVLAGVPTGDPAATFVVEGRGAYELLRREGVGGGWGTRRRLVLTLRPRERRAS